jgi:membrane protease YdiL (CAAX protease family)
MKHLEASFAGKNAFWRYFFMLAAVLAASNTIGAIPLFIILGIKAVENPEISAELSANPNDLSPLGLNPYTGLIVMLIPFIAGLAAFVLLIRPLNGRTLMNVINGTGSFRWRNYFVSAVVWIILSVIYLFGYLKAEPSNFSLNNSTLSLIILVIISLTLIPFQAAWEEIIFRGYLMQGFAVLLRNRWLPLIITSFLFALMHWPNPEVKEFGFLTMMPYYTIFGLIFGIMTLLDDGIEAAMGAHTANNVFLCIMVTNEFSALQTPALYEMHEMDPSVEFISMLITGVLVILILKIVLGWRNYVSMLAGKVGPDTGEPAQIS